MVSTVRVVFRKWGDAPHWEYEAELLGRDDFGTWLCLRQGTLLSRPGLSINVRGDRVLLFPDDQPWAAMFSAGPREATETDLYVDVCTVPVWSANLVTMIDLDLDVARRSDGLVELLDEDEFEEHRVAFGYPEDLVQLARRTAAALVDAVAGGEEPFGQAWLAWAARAAEGPR